MFLVPRNPRWVKGGMVCLLGLLFHGCRCGCDQGGLCKWPLNVSVSQVVGFSIAGPPEVPCSSLFANRRPRNQCLVALPVALMAGWNGRGRTKDGTARLRQPVEYEARGSRCDLDCMLVVCVAYAAGSYLGVPDWPTVFVLSFS